MHRITITDTAESFSCPENRSVLTGMAATGRKGIPVGCRSGGCGVCKIRITQGAVTRKVMSRAHVSAEEEAQGFALACRIFPQSAIELTVIGKLRRVFDQPEKQTMDERR